MKPIILLILLVIVWKVVGGKKRKEKAELRAKQEAEAAARKKAEREARLVKGEPVECTAVPSLESSQAETAVGPNGKTYQIPRRSEYDYFLGCWDPVFRLLTAEHYAERMYQDFIKYRIADSDTRALVNCILFAAESYAYGTADPSDLYQSERALIRRIEDRARALEDDGYLHNAYVPVDMDKAIHYYKLLENMMSHQDKIGELGDATIYRMMRAWAELGHLYGYQKKEKESRRYYDMGFRGVANDELLQLDVLHAMMAGYPRNPETYSNMLAAMMVDWIKSGKPLAIMMGGFEYASFEKLDKARLAASPEEAVKVYTEGMENDDVYCTYMLGRCALYGYGREQDTNYGWTCLETAAKLKSVSAASLLVKLSAGDAERQKGYREVYDLILEAGKKVKL